MAADAFRFFRVDGILLHENSLAIVDACIRTIEGGRLSVLAQETGLYLWECSVFRLVFVLCCSSGGFRQACCGAHSHVAISLQGRGLDLMFHLLFGQTLLQCRPFQT